jgi:hypothetical protein
MTRTEQAAFRRLDKRRDELFKRMCIISAWIHSPWCAPTTEELVARIAKLVTESIEEERAEQRKEQEKRHD